jgi:hypothetical protein
MMLSACIEGIFPLYFTPGRISNLYPFLLVGTWSLMSHPRLRAKSSILETVK